IALAWSRSSGSGGCRGRDLGPDESRAEQAHARLAPTGRKVSVRPVDVSVEEAVVEELGRIDAVFANAVFGWRTPDPGCDDGGLPRGRRDIPGWGRLDHSRDRASHGRPGEAWGARRVHRGHRLH
ncbi:MAG: hypothetical protein ACREQ5_21475, partial [Candidatus Dormibacteria bacterium]